MCYRNDLTKPELEIRKLSEVELQEVQWLWYPYIPFGKITIIQGDPGEGKTTFALRLAAACSTGNPLPGMEQQEPIHVIYQTAEDGLGDTIKPRLEDAGADCSRVFVVNEDKAALTFTDTRIEDAITATGARLLILDPLQAYLGAQVDMHRANEVRPAFHALAGIAQRTGCAIVLVGHMNKTKGQGGLYRGLGSIDIAGAARSILLVRREKDAPDILDLAHIKSNLAPLGPTLSFSTGDGRVSFLGTSDITAEELLHGGESEGDQVPTKVMLDFVCRATGGTPRPSEENSKTAWYPLDQARELITAPAIAVRFQAYLAYTGRPAFLEYVTWPTYELKTKGTI